MEHDIYIGNRSDALDYLDRIIDTDNPDYIEAPDQREAVLHAVRDALQREIC